MRNKLFRYLSLVTLLVVLVLLVTMPVAAQKTPKSDYELSWFADEGGAYIISPDGTYALGATVGQPATDISNGDYSIQAGFWSGVVDASQLYLPLIIK